MRLRALVRPVPAEWLLGSGTLLLVIFHYLLRADTVGVFSRERGWHPLTQGPVPLPLHYLAAALVLGVLPLILARAATGKSLAQLGLGLGDWRSGLRWLAVGLPLAVLRLVVVEIGFCDDFKRRQSLWFVAKDTDAVWRDRESWVWSGKPIFANGYVRLFACPAAAR